MIFSSGVMLVSDPLAALLLCHVITACRFMVYSSQRPHRFGLSLSGIAPKLNRSKLYGWLQSAGVGTGPDPGFAKRGGRVSKLGEID